METIFNNIIDAKDNLEDIIDGIESEYLHDYYALFISAMAYWNVIKLSPDFAAKLHVIILNTGLKDTDGILDKIFNFIINKSVEDVCDEITKED